MNSHISKVNEFKQTINSTRRGLDKKSKEHQFFLEVEDSLSNLIEELNKVNDIRSAMDVCRHVVEGLIVHFLSFHGVHAEGTFNDKEELLKSIDEKHQKKLLNHPALLLHIKSLRLTTNLKVHGSSLLEREANLVLDTALLIADIFCDRVLNSEINVNIEKPITKVVPIQTEKKFVDPKSNPTTNVNQVKINQVKKIDEKKIPSSGSESGNTSDDEKSDPVDEKRSICMYHVCGVCKNQSHDHRKEKMSTILQYTKIGSKECANGKKCVWRNKKIKLADGQVTNACLYVHVTDESSDRTENLVKIALAKKWIQTLAELNKK